MHIINYCTIIIIRNVFLQKTHLNHTLHFKNAHTTFAHALSFVHARSLNFTCTCTLHLPLYMF